MSWNSYGGWPPYVPVAERRRRAARKVAKLKKAGHKIAPIEIAGRKIAATPSGAMPGARTSSRTATTRTACLAAGPTCATVR